MVVNGHDISSVVSSTPPVNRDGLVGGVGGGIANIILQLAYVADDIPAWGTYMQARDARLREFTRSESMLQSALYGTAARYASFKFVLEGPERQVNMVHRMLHQSEHGKGWQALMLPTVKDYLGQDNGSWIETVRSEDSEIAPVIQLNHLDTGRCTRTGNWETPVMYNDSLTGTNHLMKWYQVQELTEYPSPDERMRGYQECAVTRLLSGAQKMRNIEIYENEKVSGRNPKSIHLVGGVQRQAVQDALAIANLEADNKQSLRYMAPVIINALEPMARVTHEQIDMAALPDGWNKEEAHREYIVLLALAIGVDPQDIAPLPGHGLGSSSQSQTLSAKGRGKGPSLYMTNVTHMMNFHGVMPQTVTFKYQEQDLEEDLERTMLKWRRAQILRLLLGANEKQEAIIDSTIARQMLRDWGDLKEEYLKIMGEQDITPADSRRSDQKQVSSGSWFSKLLGR